MPSFVLYSKRRRQIINNKHGKLDFYIKRWHRLWKKNKAGKTKWWWEAKVGTVNEGVKSCFIEKVRLEWRFEGSFIQKRQTRAIGCKTRSCQESLKNIEKNKITQKSDLGGDPWNRRSEKLWRLDNVGLYKSLKRIFSEYYGSHCQVVSREVTWSDMF